MKRLAVAALGLSLAGCTTHTITSTTALKDDSLILVTTKRTDYCLGLITSVRQVVHHCSPTSGLQTKCKEMSVEFPPE